MSLRASGAAPADAARKRFTVTFAAAVLLSVLAAALLAPLVAYALALAGAHLPFPRIFDRVVMVTAGVGLALAARPLGLPDLLRSGFHGLRTGLPPVVAGLAGASAIMAALLALALWFASQPVAVTSLAARGLRYGGAALLIAVIEESFFRAILLGGLRRDFGARVALVASSAVYALAHLVRAPAHYYLSGFHPAAGLDNLAASLARLAHPDGLLAMLFGLFLLGLALGEGFLLTRRVYLSIGLHAGFVMGAKCWPLVAAAAPRAIPGWLAGRGPVPLIAAPTAWLAAVALIIAMRLWYGVEARRARGSIARR